jgi:hypothetical protein
MGNGDGEGTAIEKESTREARGAPTAATGWEWAPRALERQTQRMDTTLAKLRPRECSPLIIDRDNPPGRTWEGEPWSEDDVPLRKRYGSRLGGRGGDSGGDVVAWALGRSFGEESASASHPDQLGRRSIQQRPQQLRLCNHYFERIK